MKKLFLLVLLVSMALADGGLIPPEPWQDLYEPTQKAVIIHRADMEDLIIQPSFKGDVTEFAWIVPVPTYPELEEASPELFRELAALTTPVHREWGIGIMGAAKMAPVGIEFHERKQVGIYDTVVMSASDTDALIFWLNYQGFNVPQSAMPVLQDYADRNWYFVIMRINATEPGTEYALQEGSIQPVLFRFRSENPVYPLRITSINKGASEILLYVFSPSRVQAQGFETEYADWVKAEQAMRYPELNKLLDGDYFLTKMRRTAWPKDMYDVWLGSMESEPFRPGQPEWELLDFGLSLVAGITYLYFGISAWATSGLVGILMSEFFLGILAGFGIIVVYALATKKKRR